MYNRITGIMDNMLKMMEKYSARLCCTDVVMAVCITGQLDHGQHAEDDGEIFGTSLLY